MPPILPGDGVDISVQIERIFVGSPPASERGNVNNEVVRECKITYELIDESN